jgi:DNA polymerase III subunit gamma/tau
LGPISFEVGMYQVLARKWRPQTLDELVGQPHVAHTLRNALESGRIAHAYVFAGVRGTGKTTVARILAKGLNCASGPTATPCNRCTPCTEIVEGRALDVLELDAASRTGVDNIRELQEIVSYAPVRDRHRVLIIDEAHMLSKAAFAALLKTLEEPPPGVVFVLATTEMHKLLPTILSRCQVFEFRRVSTREISAHLRRIVDAEGITIQDRTLDEIARAGDGSVRDALSVLERVLAFAGSEVSEQTAREVLGGTGVETLVAFARGMAAHDARSLLAALDGVVDEGHDLVHFWGELVGVVRDLMLLSAWPEGKGVVSRSAEEIALLAEAGAAMSLEDWTRVFQILAAMEVGLKASSQPRFLFEGALIRIAGLGSVRPIETILASLSGERAPAPPAPAVPGPTAPQKKNVPDSPGHAEARELIVAALQKERPMIAAMVGQASRIVLDGGQLSISFGSQDDGVRKMLAGEENVRWVEGVAAKTVGRPITVRIEGGPPVAKAPTLVERASGDPAIQRVVGEFGAHLVDVRPARDIPPTEDSA